MKELNELIEALYPQYGAPGSRDMDVTARRKAIDESAASIAEAFRAMEQRAEAAEAKLAALNPPKVECTCCNGHGCVPEMIDDEEWRDIECPDCLGAGQIKEAK